MPTSADNFIDSLKPGEGAVFSTTAASPEYAAMPAQSDDDTYADWMNSLASGTHGLGASAAALLSQGALSRSAQKYWAAQAQDQRDQAGTDIDTMTPAARKSLDAPITSPDFWHAPLRAVTLKGLQMAPGAAAMIGPALAAGPFGGAAATAAGAVSGGAVTAGQALSDFQQFVDETPDSDLRKNPEYNDYRQTHSEADTKTWWANQRASETGLAMKAGAAGALMGIAGPGATAARGALGAAGRGFMAGTLTGALEAGGGQFAQDLGSRLAIQQAQGGIGPQQTFGQMAGAAAAGAAPWAVMGGIGGGIHGLRERGADKEPPSEEERPPEGAPDWSVTQPEPDYTFPHPTPGTEDEGMGVGPQRFTSSGTVGAEPTPPLSDRQAPSPQTDAAKKEAAQQRHDKPVAGRNASIEGTGRYGLKPGAEVKPAEGAPDKTVSTISSPVADDQQVALEATQPGWANSRWQMIREIKAANPGDTRSFQDFLKLNRNDLTAEHSKLQAVKEPQAPAVEQPQIVQPTPAAQERPQEAQKAPIQPGAIHAAGQGIEPASAFAQEPPEPIQPRTAPPREVEPGSPEYGDFAERIAALEKAQQDQGVRPETEGASDQQASTVQPKTVQREPVVSKLQAVTPLAEAVEAQRSRERVAAAQAKEEAITRPEGAGKKWTKDQIAARTANNKVADEIVARHRLEKDSKDWLALDPSKAGGKGSLSAMISRLRGMVDDTDKQIKAGHFTPPKEFNVMPSGSNMPDHSPSVLAIQEARRFLKGLKRYKTESGQIKEVARSKDDISSHLDRELALTGKHLTKEQKGEYYRKILPERVSEAEERMAQEERGPRAGVVPLEEKHEEAIAAPTKEEEPAEEPIQERAKAVGEIEKSLESIPPHPTGEDATRADWLKWKQAILDHPITEHVLRSPRVADERLNPKDNLPWSDKTLKFETYMRQFQDALRDRYEKSGLAAEKAKITEAAVQAKPEPAKLPAVKPEAPVDEEAALKKQIADLQAKIAEADKAPAEKQEVTARAPDGSNVSFVPKKTTTVRELLPKLDPKVFPKGLESMGRLIVNKISDVAGDTPVHLVDRETMNQLLPDPLGADAGTDGLYDPKLNHIILDTDRNRSAAKDTLFHEAFHAATVQGLHKAKDLLFNLTKLWREVDGKQTSTNPVEWLTRVMTDRNILEQYKTMKISPELAKALDIPVWRKKTVFEGILNTIRKALGLGPRDVGAVEAALAISERAMEYREAELQKGIEARAGTEPKVYYHEAVADRLDKEYKGMTGQINKFLKTEVSPRQRGFLMWLKEKFNSPREWMTEMVNKLGKNNVFANNARMWFERMAAQGRLRTIILKQTDALMKKLVDFQRSGKPGEFTKLVNLLISSTLNGAHPDYELGQGLNKFIGVSDPNNPSKSNNAYWRAIQGHAEDRAAYIAMDRETQQMYKDIRNAMMLMHQKDLKAARDSFAASMRKHLDRMDQSEGLKDAYEKVVNGEQLTKEEQALYGDDKNIMHLQTYDKMLADSDKGPYFPMQRTARKYSIVGQYKYDAPKNGVRDPDNPHRWTFDGPDARKNAYNFVNGLKTSKGVRLPSYRDIRHYYLDNGEKVYKTDDGRTITADEKRVTPDDRGEVTPAEEHIVEVDPSHVEFANSYREGEDIQRAMLEAGVDPKSITDIAPAKDQPLQRYGFYGPQVQAMMNRTDKLHYLSEAERKGAQEAIEHAALTSMKGNYLTQNLLRRNGVLGAGDDIIQALDRRRKVSANFQAMAAHRFDIDDHLEQMKRYVDENRTHEHYADMQAAYNTFEDRTVNWQADNNDNLDTSAMWHRIRSFATLKYLASPAFLVYHQLHVPLVVIPRLAQDIGWFPAFRLALGTYRQMLGGLPVIGKGVAGAFKRAWDIEEEPHDFIDLLKKQAEKNGFTFDELQAVKWAEDQDLMHHSGFNFASFYKNMNFADRMEHRTQNFSQEFIGSADAVNRFNSYMMFYRAAKSLGKTGEEAYRWAGDRVAETQGQFTAFNRVGMFRDPKVRAVLQFKSFPLILMKTVTKALYNSLRWGASGEERWAAMKSLGGLMGASMALSGVQGAVPEPIEDVNNILSAFGLTKSWDEYEDKLRTMVANDMGGPEAANLVMGGLGAGLGVDFTHRGGISDLTGLSQLHVTKASDLESSLFKYLAGVPGSEAGDMIEGVNAISSGDLQGAMKFILPRMLTDPIKAYQLYNEGVTTMAGKTIGPPAGITDATKRVFGFTTQYEAKTRQARFVTGVERGEETSQREQIETMWKQGDRGGALRAMAKYNRDNPDYPIKSGDLERVTRGMKRPTLFGYQESPSRRRELQERAQAYGLQ